ncbi:PTS sugar transporter subunit IIB [Radiobacillus deserti]|uniref:PTS sugar transporter subunit IIB n=1 Tax=Radiobacillus deserti TaxID=2594883 RepID=A0A516KCB6_9BACI|nr:PTS sugar transporter subunit IIB [Radiobacillus deserti]QDP38986.1 PTS sugar transporter subunit IIB [Radiobacillus deserti]
MNILLVCSAGMSTSMLVSKMRAEAEKREMDATINAVSESELKNHLDGLDVVLIGPQVRYLERKIKEQLEPKGIKVDVINQMAYGMMQGDKVLDQAVTLAK